MVGGSNPGSPTSRVPPQREDSFNVKLFKNDYFVAAFVGLILTALTFAVAVLFKWIAPEDVKPVEMLAAFINYGSFYLSVKQRRAFYLFGVAASLLYFTVYLSADLLASGVLQLYLIFPLIYGFFRWGKDKQTRPVKHLDWRWSPVYILATAAIWGGAVWLVTSLGGAFAPWDSAILVLTILAQLLLDQKKLETWWVWIGVNVISAILYFQSSLVFAAVQQLLFLVANLWGWYSWRKTLVR